LSSRLKCAAVLAWVGAFVGACSGSTGSEADPSADAQITEIASPLQSLPGYSVVSAETPLSTLAMKQLSVACPAGTKVLGAGFGVLDSTSAILDGVATYSAPSWNGASWLTNARKLSGFTNEWKLRVSIVCANDTLAGYEVRVAETPTDPNAVKQLISHCPRGKVATSAGFGVLDDTSAILDGEALYSLPHYDGKGWLTNARKNSVFSPSWKLRTRMICVAASALPGYQVVMQDTVVDTFPVKQLNVACPRGRRTLGAGFGVLDETSAILDGVALYSLPSYDGASWLTNAKNYDTSFAPAFKLRVTTLCAE
jgi:hypothetical protein